MQLRLNFYYINQHNWAALTYWKKDFEWDHGTKLSSMFRRDLKQTGSSRSEVFK